MTFSSPHPLRTLPAALLLACLAPASTWAIDVDAGDYVPAPAGTTLGLLYAQHAERNHSYQNGIKNGGNLGLNSNVGILRMVKYLEIGGLTVAPEFLLPFGQLQAQHDSTGVLGSGKTSGVGDLILAAPIWVINDASRQTYWAITPYLFLPTGQYRNTQALNLGENRWKLNLQTGYSTPLSSSWTLDLTGDVMLHGDNTAYTAANATLKQAALYQAQAHLRHPLGTATTGFIGLSQSWGGERKVNGVAQNDQTKTLKFSLGASHFIRPTTQLLVSVGRDLKVDNGFKESARLNLRLLEVF